MTLQLDTTKLFDQEVWSDISITFGSQTIKAHKIILCSRSAYFNKLCGPDSRWMEASATTIKLEGDKEDAVHALLHYIYHFDYSMPAERPQGKGAQALFHMDMIQVSDKYGIDDLNAKARDRFETQVASLEDGEIAWGIIMTMANPKHGYDTLLCPEKDVADKHLDKLIDPVEFREWVATRPDYLHSIMKRGVQGHNFKEAKLATCTGCWRGGRMVDAVQIADGSWKCVQGGHTLTAAVMSSARTIWVKK